MSSLVCIVKGFDVNSMTLNSESLWGQVGRMLRHVVDEVKHAFDGWSEAFRT